MKNNQLKLTVFVNFEEQLILYPPTVEVALHMKEAMSHLLLTASDDLIYCTAFILEVYSPEEEEWKDWFSEDGIAFDELEYEFGDLRVKPVTK